jgi:hypothetical protein
MTSVGEVPTFAGSDSNRMTSVGEVPAFAGMTSIIGGGEGDSSLRWNRNSEPYKHLSVELSAASLRIVNEEESSDSLSKYNLSAGARAMSLFKDYDPDEFRISFIITKCIVILAKARTFCPLK